MNIKMLETINPANGEKLQSYPLMNDQLLKETIDGVSSTQQSWKNKKVLERVRPMNALSIYLKENKQSLAKIITEEMGKPISQSVSEVEKCAWLADYYNEKGAEFLQDQPVTTEFKKSKISFAPLGIIFAVMPWNFPLWQVFRCAVPAVVAGNGVVLKHAANVTGCALRIEQAFKEAGFPDELFKTLLISREQTDLVVDHPAVRAVTLTGSVEVGRKIGAKAGASLRKVVLELGGSDPYLVLADADLEQAAIECATARLINTGQSCIAGKRFIVDDRVYDEFIALFKKQLDKPWGDPMDEKTALGPLARKDLQQTIHQQVQTCKSEGARLMLGGTLPETEGFYYPSTLLVDVPSDGVAFKEEFFGPVALVTRAIGDKDAIRLANQTAFGLGASIFTRDTEKGEALAASVEAGMVFVNGYVRSDPRLPFGGIKDSGIGRELSSFGIHELTNIKTIVVI